MILTGVIIDNKFITLIQLNWQISATLFLRFSANTRVCCSCVAYDLAFGYAQYIKNIVNSMQVTTADW